MAQGSLLEVVPIRGGAKPAIKKLRQLIRTVRDTRRPNKQVSIWLLRWVSRNFKTEGGKVGGWAPLRPATIAARKKGPGSGRPKILRDTGALEKSINNFYSRRVAGVGSRLSYSARHDVGFPMDHIPRRRILPVASDKDVTHAIIKIYDVYITRALQR